MPKPYSNHTDLLEVRCRYWETRTARTKTKDDRRYCQGMLAKVRSDLKSAKARAET